MIEHEYRLGLDKELTDLIKEVIAIEVEQKDLDPSSQKWFELQGDISDKLQEIAWSIVYDFKQLPF